MELRGQIRTLWWPPQLPEAMEREVMDPLLGPSAAPVSCPLVLQLQLGVGNPSALPELEKLFVFKCPEPFLFPRLTMQKPRALKILPTMLGALAIKGRGRGKGKVSLLEGRGLGWVNQFTSAVMCCRAEIRRAADQMFLCPPPCSDALAGCSDVVLRHLVSLK